MLSLKRTDLLSIFIVLLLSIPSIISLFLPGFIQTDDGDWMVIRFSAFYQALSDGQFPVRWLTRLNYSYGYPVANFLYPGFMYMAVPLKVIGFSFQDSIKLVIAASMLGSSMFCFLWLRKMFSNLSSCIGALLYLYLPYHIYDLYQRGSVGELLALAVVPFILWQIERKSFIGSALGIGFLILSHNTLALLFFPILFIYIFLKEDFRKLIYWYLSIVITGVGLAAFFWIPALFELQQTVFSQTNISNWIEYFSQISIVGLVVPFVLLGSLIVYVTEHPQQRKLAILFFVVGIIALFFSTKLSSLLWNFLPISFIQFPFRLLSVLILCIAFLGSWIIQSVNDKKIRIGLIVVIVFLLLPTFTRMLYVSRSDKSDEVFATNEDTTTVQKEYMPVSVSQPPLKRPDAFITVGDKNTTFVLRPTTDVSFSLNAEKPTTVVYNQFFFPGWNVLVDGHPVEIDLSKNGRISFFVSEGSHSVRIFFAETLLRIIADLVSIFALISLVFLPIVYRKNAYATHTKIL